MLYLEYTANEEGYDYSRFNDQVLEYKFPGNPSLPFFLAASMQYTSMYCENVNAVSGFIAYLSDFDSTLLREAKQYPLTIRIRKLLVYTGAGQKVYFVDLNCY